MLVAVDLMLSEVAAGDAAVGVDAAVAQEGPVAAGVFEQGAVDFGDEDFFAVVRGLRDDAAEGVGDEGAAPELEACAFGAFEGDAVVRRRRRARGLRG